MPAYRLFNTWRTCATDKETYVEALRALQVRCPALFAVLRKACATRRRTFFAQDPVGLFLASPHLADTSAHYMQIIPGWYVDTNLSNRQKENILMHACGVAGISYFSDLEIRFELGHYSPISAKEAASLADSLLEELRSLPPAKLPG